MRFASDGHRGTKVLLGALGVLLWVALSALLSSTAAHADDRGAPPAKRTETVAAASASPNAHTPKRAAAAPKASEMKAPPVSSAPPVPSTPSVSSTPSAWSTPSVSGPASVSSTAPAPKAERRAEQAASPAPRGDARPAAPSSIGDVARETVGAVATEPVGASVQASKVVTTAKTAKALTQADAARQAKDADQAGNAASTNRAKSRAHARELPPAASERAGDIQRRAADLDERARRSHDQRPSASHGWRHSDADTASQRHPLPAPPTATAVISSTAAAPVGTAPDGPDAPTRGPADVSSTGVHPPPAALSAAAGASNGAPFTDVFPTVDPLVDAHGVLLAAARAADDILLPAPVGSTDVSPD